MVKKTSQGPRKSSKRVTKPKKTSQKFQVLNELGLHARAAALFVKIASQFRSEILIQKGNQEVNGKSIMGILMLAAARGSQITVSAIGKDAQKALKELGKLIQDRFGESDAP
jgi:phosphocarrier protein HPr